MSTLSNNQPFKSGKGECAIAPLCSPTLEPAVSVVISTWRRVRLLRRLLFSLARQRDRLETEIIVADSHSPDGTAAMIERFSRRVRPVRIVQTKNALAAKRNIGAAVARGAYLVFLDDDLLVEGAETIRQVVQETRIQRRPVCFRVNYPSGWVATSNYYRFKQASHDQTNVGPQILQPFRFVAMAFCISKELYVQTGGFMEEFKTYGGEDHAFEFALRRIGVVATLSREASVLHYETSPGFGVYLEQKFVATIRDAYPTLFSVFPESRNFARSNLLETAVAKRAINAVPTSVFLRLLRLYSRHVQRMPMWIPTTIVRLVGRVGLILAYCVGVRTRN